MTIVNSVDRAIRAIHAVGESPDGALSLTELSTRLGAPKSTTHNLCETLVKHSLLRKRKDGTYDLGVGLVALGRHYQDRLRIVDGFSDAVSQTTLLSERTTVLAVLSGSDVVYVACRKGTHSIGVSYDVGLRLPASSTATGKALLATLPDETVRGLYKEHQPPQLTQHSIDSVDWLLEELAVIRTRGYAIDVEETAIGMCCIGVALKTGMQEGPPAAIALSQVKADHLNSDFESIVSDLKSVANALSVGG